MNGGRSIGDVVIWPPDEATTYSREETMPIFMDRHELAGVSAADIAAALTRNCSDKPSHL